MHLAVVLRTLRPPFLVLTPACVMLGYATARSDTGQVDPLLLLAALAAALFAHISVNTLNEYHDFISGLDLQTRRTPFSGGSGALPAHPDSAASVLVTGLVSLGVVVLAGSYFLYLRGLALLPAGLAGVLLIVTYTRWLNRMPWLCLVAPGLGFGPLMVAGTHFALTGELSALPVTAAVVPFFLTNNLLMLNQYPDIVADADNGRNNVPIAYGTVVANAAYGLSAGAAGLTLLFGVYADILPAAALTALVPLALAVIALTGAVRHHGDIGRYPQFLAANAAAAILTPAVLAAALLQAG
jgi:1,4-dihydroxy-2-naphthoate octaprenyltransferase